MKVNISMMLAITLNPGMYHIWKISVTRWCLERRRTVLCGNCFCTRQLVFCYSYAGRRSATSSSTL